MKRWEHKVKLDPGEPDGCGYPVCAIVDARPKRFVSLCNFTAWAAEEGLTRRVFELQKGGCEDVSELKGDLNLPQGGVQMQTLFPAVEGKGLDRRWAPPLRRCDCGGHAGCEQPVCINDNGGAKFFPSVCRALRYLGPRKRVKVISLGLGKCKPLYSGELQVRPVPRPCGVKRLPHYSCPACIYTEWFDLDEPCSKGEVESVYVTNVFASRLGKYVSAL